MVELIDTVESFVQDLGQSDEVLFEVFLADRKQTLLRLIEQGLEVHVFLVAQTDDISGSRDESSKSTFSSDDVGVMHDMGRGRHSINQTGQVAHAADFLEGMSFLEFIGCGQDVDR